MIACNLVKCIENEHKFQVFNLSYKKSQLMNTETVYDTLLDTGASIHIVCDRKFFTKLDTNMNFESAFLEMADGNKSSDIIKGRGTAKIPITDVLGSK